MAQTHTWFATNTDAKLIVAWLRASGAVASGTQLPEGDFPADGRELICHFPSIGPLQFWPDKIQLSDYPESSTRWRQAVITTVRQRERPGIQQVDADRSAVAGLRMPELRDGQHHFRLRLVSRLAATSHFSGIVAHLPKVRALASPISHCVQAPEGRRRPTIRLSTLHEWLRSACSCAA